LAFSSLFAVPDVPLMTLKLKVLEVGIMIFVEKTSCNIKRFQVLNKHRN